jgi:hypothetical protein
MFDVVVALKREYSGKLDHSIRAASIETKERHKFHHLYVLTANFIS